MVILTPSESLPSFLRLAVLSMLVCVSGSMYMNVGVIQVCFCICTYRECMLSLTTQLDLGHDVVAASPVLGCQMQQLLIHTVCTFSLQMFLSLSSSISY